MAKNMFGEVTVALNVDHQSLLQGSFLRPNGCLCQIRKKKKNPQGVPEISC